MRNKKIIAFFCVLALLISFTAAFAGCGDRATNGKPTIVCTTFPHYDWVRQILGDRVGEYNLVLLQDTGVDLHSFQPTTEDIVTIAACDFFVYVGGESDKWVEGTLSNKVNEDMVIVNLMTELGSRAFLEEEIEGAEHEHEHEEGEEHEEEYDEHLWLSLKNAAFLTEILTAKLSAKFPSDKEVFETNSTAYISRLNVLDTDFATMCSTATYDTLLVCDRFPFRYLVEDYGLKYFAAFSGCSAETEASVQTVTFLSGKLSENNLKHVVILEGSSTKIANTVISSSGMQNVDIIELDSLQTVTAEKVANGAEYITLMQANLDALRRALN